MTSIKKENTFKESQDYLSNFNFKDLANNKTDSLFPELDLFES